MSGRNTRTVWAIAALFLILALLPLLAQFGAQAFILGLVTRAMIFAIAALSLDLILGYGALVSFGHAAFLASALMRLAFFPHMALTAFLCRCWWLSALRPFLPC